MAVVLSFPVLIIATWFNNKALAALFGNRRVYHLGVISYSIYLWHPLFRDITGRALAVTERHGFTGYDILFSLAGVALTWAVSWASHALIEVRGRRLLNRLTGNLVPAHCETGENIPAKAQHPCAQGFPPIAKAQDFAYRPFGNSR